MKVQVAKIEELNSFEPTHVLRKHVRDDHTAGFRIGLQTGRYVNAVAEDFAVVQNDIGCMNPHAEIDAATERFVIIVGSERSLHANHALRGVVRVLERRKKSVTGV